MATFNPRAYLKDIKGQDYLDVAHRVYWLNEAVARFDVATEPVQRTPDYAVVRATVTLYDDEGAVMRRATGHGQANKATAGNYSGRYLEKAETSAIGRALASLGFGTLGAREFEED